MHFHRHRFRCAQKAGHDRVACACGGRGQASWFFVDFGARKTNQEFIWWFTWNSACVCMRKRGKHENILRVTIGLGFFVWFLFCVSELWTTCDENFCDSFSPERLCGVGRRRSEGATSFGMVDLFLPWRRRISRTTDEAEFWVAVVSSRWTLFFSDQLTNCGEINEFTSHERPD